MSNYKEQLENARELYRFELEGIAARARQEFVVPLCQKYDLEFLAGNGDFWFEPPKGAPKDEPRENIYDSIDAHNEGYDAEEFQKVFKVLNTEADRRSALGEWMFGYERPKAG